MNWIGIDKRIQSRWDEMIAMTRGSRADQRTKLTYQCAAAMFPVMEHIGRHLEDHNISLEQGLPILTAAFGHIVSSASGASGFSDDTADTLIEDLPKQLAITITECMNHAKKKGMF